MEKQQTPNYEPEDWGDEDTGEIFNADEEDLDETKGNTNKITIIICIAVGIIILGLIIYVLCSKIKLQKVQDNQEQINNNIISNENVNDMYVDDTNVNDINVSDTDVGDMNVDNLTDEEVLAMLSEDNSSTIENGTNIDINLIYTNEQIEQLRANGYTGTEIEQFSNDGKNYDLLIIQAENLRQQQYEKSYQEFLNTTSEAYQELYKNSWIGQNPIPNKIQSINSDSELYQGYYIKTVNADYNKVPARGHQYYLRLYWKEYDCYLFMQVSQFTYQSIPESDNIVVSIEYALFNDYPIVEEIKQKVID